MHVPYGTKQKMRDKQAVILDVSISERRNDIMRFRKRSGPWFNINMSSYQYMKSHCGDKTVVILPYFHNGIFYTGKMTSLYWIGAQVTIY